MSEWTVVSTDGWGAMPSNLSRKSHANLERSHQISSDAIKSLVQIPCKSRAISSNLSSKSHANLERSHQISRATRSYVPPSHPRAHPPALPRSHPPVRDRSPANLPPISRQSPVSSLPPHLIDDFRPISPPRPPAKLGRRGAAGASVARVLVLAFSLSGSEAANFSPQ